MADATLPDLPKLQSLIGHREFVHATDTLEAVHRRFAANKQDFLAVLSGRKLIGLSARRDIGTVLGARFGFALHAREPVASHLSYSAVQFSIEQPLPEVLKAIAARRDEHFYDDILLTDRHGDFLGLVYVRDLVRLQNTLLLENLAELTARQEEIASRNRQMEDDLRMAREVQMALMPREMPTCRGRDGNVLRIVPWFQPAGGVSGDFFDVFALADDRAGLIVCDVMGHGVRSALVTSMIRTLLEELRPRASNPAEFLTQLNAQLSRLLRRSGELIFVTAFFVLVDASAATISYAHAGHPFPIHWSARNGTTSVLPDLEQIGGPAIGLLEDHVYECATHRLESGDRLLLYTDGIIEAASPADEEFGLERLTDVFASVARRPLAEAIKTLPQTAATFAKGRPFGDDLCLLMCELESKIAP